MKMSRIAVLFLAFLFCIMCAGISLAEEKTGVGTPVPNPDRERMVIPESGPPPIPMPEEKMQPAKQRGGTGDTITYPATGQRPAPKPQAEIEKVKRTPGVRPGEITPTPAGQSGGDVTPINIPLPEPGKEGLRELKPGDLTKEACPNQLCPPIPEPPTIVPTERPDPKRPGKETPQAEIQKMPPGEQIPRELPPPDPKPLPVPDPSREKPRQFKPGDVSPKPSGQSGGDVTPINIPLPQPGKEGVMAPQENKGALPVPIPRPEGTGIMAPHENRGMLPTPIPRPEGDGNKTPMENKGSLPTPIPKPEK